MAFFENGLIYFLVDLVSGDTFFLDWRENHDFLLGLLLDNLGWENGGFLLGLWVDLFLLAVVRLNHAEWADWLEAWEAESLDDLGKVSGWLLARHWDLVSLVECGVLALGKDLVELLGHGRDFSGHLFLLFLESEEESGLVLDSSWHLCFKC